MKEQMFNFIDNFSSPFFVGSIAEEKVMYSNQKAKESFGELTTVSDFDGIFTTNEIIFEEFVKEMLRKGKTALLYNIIVRKVNGEKMMVDIQLGYFNEEKTLIFLNLTEQNDTRMEMARYQVNISSKAEAILNFNENLEVLHCNNLFHRVFESNEELCYAHYDKQFINRILPELREQLVADILSNLKKSTTYSTKTKIQTTTGEERWYLLELERHTLDNSGMDKVIAYMMDIDEQVEIEENYSILNQYLIAMQEISDDVLLRIDVETMTLHRLVEDDKVGELGRNIPNYMDVLANQNIIHPEDAQKYVRYAEEWFAGKRDGCALRFMVAPDKYEWFDIRVKKIYDENGQLKDVFGKLVNIQEKMEMKQEYSKLNKYFTVMQNLTEQTLFYVDAETKILHHSIQVALNMGMPNEIYNYIDTFIERGYVDPKYAEDFRTYNEKLLLGEIMEYEVPLLVERDIYEWHRVNSQPIYDNGEVVEIFGTMENVQWKKDLEAMASHDRMTNVLNKVTFEEKVEELLKSSMPDEKHALVFVDLDDFKGVNDTLGHAFGDSMLIAVGKRLKQVTRQSDLVGRVGGDEFVVLLRNINDEGAAIGRTKILLENLQRSFSFDNKAKSIKASLGISIFPQHGATYKELITKSDLALYTSKEKGKNAVTLYTGEMK